MLGVTSGSALSPTYILWVKYGIMTGAWNHAFKLLRK
jgi:hypothetical protein